MGLFLSDNNQREEDLRAYATSVNLIKIKELIEKGVNVNATDSGGWIALHNCHEMAPPFKR